MNKTPKARKRKKYWIFLPALSQWWQTWGWMGKHVFIQHIATHTSHIVNISLKFMAFIFVMFFLLGFFSEALNLIHRSDKINIPWYWSHRDDARIEWKQRQEKVFAQLWDGNGEKCFASAPCSQAPTSRENSLYGRKPQVTHKDFELNSVGDPHSILEHIIHRDNVGGCLKAWNFPQTMWNENEK